MLTSLFVEAKRKMNRKSIIRRIFRYCLTQEDTFICRK